MPKKMQNRKLSELKLVYPLYPRAKVDSQHVASIRDAIQAGCELPPIVIDTQNRVVDGFHRITAYRSERGEHHVVAVEVKKYADDGEFFLDAVHYNAAHGRMLSSYDRSHIAIAADNLKIAPAVIAQAMHVRVERLQSITVNKIAQVSIKTNGTRTVRRVPLKRTIRHMAGRDLTAEQQEANEKLGGMNQLFYVNQLVMLIENDLLDKENLDLLERLKKLGGLIDSMAAAAV